MCPVYPPQGKNFSQDERQSTASHNRQRWAPYPPKVGGDWFLAPAAPTPPDFTRETRTEQQLHWVQIGRAAEGFLKKDSE